ncbi:MFS transporter [Streptomyces sp. NPDC001820]|uniref:MFS transporter n=1 Tax=Streptomyces sp. NPDC001820 TaxID=3364613 RepID=UPI0036C1399C
MATSYRSLLGQPVFRLLWTGESAGRLGFQLANFLLPLIAVTVLHESGTRVGVISTAQFVPVVLFALVAGALAGRWPLRGLLVACNALRAGALGFVVSMHAAVGLHFLHLIIAAAVVGVATVFYDVAYQASIPQIVPVEGLSRANGLMQATYSVTQLAGPALAGFLTQSLGMPVAVGTACALFMGALLSFVAMPPLLQAHSSQAPASLAKSIRQGLGFVWRCRPLRDLCLQAGVSNLLEQAFLTAFMVYSVRDLGMSGGTVGLVVGAGGVGALVGSLTAPRIRRVRVGVLVSTALPAAGLAFVLVPASITAFAGAAPPLMLAFALNGAAVSVFNVYAVSLRQSIPPEELLGSATASYRLVSFGTFPIGALLGGTLIDAVGGVATLWLIALMLTVSLSMFFGSPLKGVPSIEQARVHGSRWTASSRSEK